MQCCHAIWSKLGLMPVCNFSFCWRQFDDSAQIKTAWAETIALGEFSELLYQILLNIARKAAGQFVSNAHTCQESMGIINKVLGFNDGEQCVQLEMHIHEEYQSLAATRPQLLS